MHQLRIAKSLWFGIYVAISSICPANQKQGKGKAILVNGINWGKVLTVMFTHFGTFYKCFANNYKGYSEVFVKIINMSCVGKWSTFSQPKHYTKRVFSWTHAVSLKQVWAKRKFLKCHDLIEWYHMFNYVFTSSHYQSSLNVVIWLTSHKRRPPCMTAKQYTVCNWGQVWLSQFDFRVMVCVKV